MPRRHFCLSFAGEGSILQRGQDLGNLGFKIGGDDHVATGGQGQYGGTLDKRTTPCYIFIVNAMLYIMEGKHMVQQLSDALPEGRP